jgi:hypothetical protein
VSVEPLATETYRPEHFPRLPSAEQGGRRIADHGASRQPRSAGDVTQSERDWAYARRALARRESPDKVRAAIAAFRARQKTDVNKYAERTVRKAMESLESDRATRSQPEIQTPR